MDKEKAEIAQAMFEILHKAEFDVKSVNEVRDCPECGICFPPECEFCSHCGTKLSDLQIFSDQEESLYSAFKAGLKVFLNSK